MKTELRPAFYALHGGAWRDYVTLLHLPYTVWHLSYLVFGAAAAPAVRLDRLGGAALAFFLAVGLAAHALDEYRGRPLRTTISDGRLLAIAVVSLAGAIAIGLIAMLTISPWAAPFVLFGGVIVLAYNLEWWDHVFHTDVWFGLAWGAFPALVGYWSSAERLDAQSFVVAAACYTLSLAQRKLSKRVRALRRDAVGAYGRIDFRDGHRQQVTVPYLLDAPESALRLTSLAVALLALRWLIAGL